jgi:hypothetical protein
MITMMMTMIIPELRLNLNGNLRSPPPPRRGRNSVALLKNPVAWNSIQCLACLVLKTRSLCPARRSTFGVQRSMFS